MPSERFIAEFTPWQTAAPIRIAFALPAFFETCTMPIRAGFFVKDKATGLAFGKLFWKLQLAVPFDFTGKLLAANDTGFHGVNRVKFFGLATQANISKSITAFSAAKHKRTAKPPANNSIKPDCKPDIPHAFNGAIAAASNRHTSEALRSIAGKKHPQGCFYLLPCFTALMRLRRS
jgi:hypothetical protein